MTGMVSTARPEVEGTKKDSAASSPNIALMKAMAGRSLTAPSAQNRIVSVILPASITTTMPRAMPMMRATPSRPRAPSTKVLTESSSPRRPIRPTRMEENRNRPLISAIHQPPAETPQIITAKVSAKTTRTIFCVRVSAGASPAAEGSRSLRKCSALDARRSATMERSGSRRTRSA